MIPARPAALISMLALLVACGGGKGGDADEDSLIVASQRTQAGDFEDTCEVVGEVLNTDGERRCEGCVDFNAFDAAGTIIDDAIDCVGVVPPNTRADYEATFFDVPCSAIARVELAEITQFCD